MPSKRGRNNFCFDMASSSPNSSSEKPARLVGETWYKSIDAQRLAERFAEGGS